ncbi:suppressor APC domain-containing protein 2-like [Chrysemys picta bellii]|uniref:suppressor APC domain-containing protein 2-like n=1 Tax=Chrysemys picta bellii TaxID=8478 RepID=UPI0032B17E1D
MKREGPWRETGEKRTNPPSSAARARVKAPPRGGKSRGRAGGRESPHFGVLRATLGATRSRSGAAGPPRRPHPGRDLRTLFEILDEQRSGAVHLSEIESRWGRGGPQHERLPPGVLPALQQVAGPSGGFLSFPCLVAGLRIALLRDQEEKQGPGPEPAETGHNSAQERTSGSQTREGEPRGVTRSRSINSALSQAGRPRSLRVQKEPRRHTITHGIDYGALQRRQARERERDALLQGLELAERLRGWYRRHLLEAQRRQEQAGAEPDYFPDSCPNQSCLLLAKIQEVNLGLRNLLASPGKADPPPCFPSSRFGGPLFQMGKQQEFQQQAVNVLKEQNRLLIKEVSEKSDRIAQLEQEKAALCRQLQESRGYRLSSHKESTFI